MSIIFLITTLLAITFGEQLDDYYSLKRTIRSLNPSDKNVDVNCFSDLNNVIYNIVPRNVIPTMELHVACNTKLDNAFRVVGDRSNPSFHCLENITTVVSWLGEFSKNAKSLDLSSNCIKNLNVVPGLPMLKILNCRHNSIETIEEAAFSSLTQLEILDLSYNSLTEEQLSSKVFQGKCIPSKLNDLKLNEPCLPLQIMVLNLGHNKIQSLQPTTFQYLYHLKELHLNNNPLSVVDANTITAIKSIAPLKVLQLSNLHISTIPYNLLDGLQIQALYLNGNNLTEVPEELSLLGKSLLYLNINDNPISVLNYDSFIGLNNLREIEAAGLPHLTSVYEGTFSHLPSLETVILSYNPQLSYIDQFAFMWSLKSPSSLKWVYLHGNNLKYLSERLLPWKQLDVVQLSGNSWTCGCKLRWYLDLTEKQSLSALRNSGLRCASTEWPNITGTDIYNRPIRKFNCAQSSELYPRYTRDSQGERLVILLFLLAIFSVIGAVLARCAYRIKQKRNPTTYGLPTLSGSIKGDLQYSRLNCKPVYNV